MNAKDNGIIVKLPTYFDESHYDSLRLNLTKTILNPIDMWLVADYNLHYAGYQDSWPGGNNIHSLNDWAGIAIM